MKKRTRGQNTGAVKNQTVETFYRTHTQKTTYNDLTETVRNTHDVRVRIDVFYCDCNEWQRLVSLVCTNAPVAALLEQYARLDEQHLSRAVSITAAYCQRARLEPIGVLSGHGRLYNEWKYNGADLTACVQLATLAALAPETTRQHPCVLFTTQRKALAMLATSEGAATTKAEE